MAGRRRVDALAERPDRATSFAMRGLRGCCGRAALYGTPDEIATKLQALRDVGAEYVLLNSAGGPPSLRRFARTS